MPAVALSPVLGVAVRAAPRAAAAARRRAPMFPTQLSTSTTTRLTRPRKHHAIRIRCSTAPRASAAGAVPPPPPRPSASKSGDGEHDATSAPLSSPARAPPGLLRHAQRAALATAVFVFFTVVLAVQGAAVTSAWNATLDWRALCASGVENVTRYVYASQAAQAAAMAFFVFTPTLNKWCRSGFNSLARSLAYAGEVRPWVTASVQMSGQGVYRERALDQHCLYEPSQRVCRAMMEYEHPP